MWSVAVKRLSVRLLLCAFSSVACLQAIYWRWPKGVCSDATYSVFAAQNAVESGRFETLEPNVRFDSDLANVKLQWCNSWPPMTSLAYAALMKCGLTPGGATNWIVCLMLVVGTCGWVLCMKEFGAVPPALYALAILIPWTSFPLLGMTEFYNDHLAWVLAPWGMVLLLAYFRQASVAGWVAWVRLPLAALVCGAQWWQSTRPCRS